MNGTIYLHFLFQIIFPEEKKTHTHAHTHTLSQKAESGCPNCEKNMQVVAECAFSDKRTGKVTIR
jgi:hypothetical protein